MREHVLRTIRENYLCQSGDRLLVAVSGGADSVCLLHLLQALAGDLGIHLHAAHLDHQLRPESGSDAEFVDALCSRLGIPLCIGQVDVASEARKRRLGLEETARAVRRGFLQETAAALDCCRVALGHHRGDQAETVLHRFLRGSGASGLTGMQLRAGIFVRPLLEIDRRQIIAYLALHRLPWVEDASNLDLSFTRNRLRHQILPLLAEVNPRVEANLAALGSRLGMEEDYWRRETEKVLLALAQGAGEDLFIDCEGLRDLHPALRARVLRAALRQVRGDLQRIEAVHLTQVEKLLMRRAPQGEVHLPGAWVGRRYARLWLRRTAPLASPPLAVDIPRPGAYPLPGGILHVEFAEKSRGEDRLAVEFDAANVRFPLCVRSFRPGDRFRPAGMEGHRKLKNYFIDAKIDREARRRVLIVEGEEILWLIGLRRCAGWQPGSGTVLRLWLQPGPGDNFHC